MSIAIRLLEAFVPPKSTRIESLLCSGNIIYVNRVSPVIRLYAEIWVCWEGSCVNRRLKVLVVGPEFAISWYDRNIIRLKRSGAGTRCCFCGVLSGDSFTRLASRGALVASGLSSRVSRLADVYAEYLFFSGARLGVAEAIIICRIAGSIYIYIMP